MEKIETNIPKDLEKKIDAFVNSQTSFLNNYIKPILPYINEENRPKIAETLQTGYKALHDVETDLLKAIKLYFDCEHEYYKYPIARVKYQMYEQHISFNLTKVKISPALKHTYFSSIEKYVHLWKIPEEKIPDFIETVFTQAVYKNIYYQKFEDVFYHVKSAIKNQETREIFKDVFEVDDKFVELLNLVDKQRQKLLKEQPIDKVKVANFFKLNQWNRKQGFMWLKGKLNEIAKPEKNMKDDITKSK